MTLPNPGVEAMFTLQEGTRFEVFPVTGGSVTPHIKVGEFTVEVEATATTPDGETISVHNGRYALVNFRPITSCQQD